MFNQDAAPLAAADLDATLAEFGHSRMLPRAAYVGPAVFDWERRHIFNSWMCVGYAADLPEPGAQRAVPVGTGSVLLTRDENGWLHAMANTCATAATSCWRVGPRPNAAASSARITRGRTNWTDRCATPLVSARSLTSTRNRSGWCRCGSSTGTAGSSSTRVARPATSRPTWPAPRTSSAPYRPEDLVIAARHSYELACNWKVIAENYQECYHCSTIHPELSRISPPTSGDNVDLPGQWMGGIDGPHSGSRNYVARRAQRRGGDRRPVRRRAALGDVSRRLSRTCWSACIPTT